MLTEPTWRGALGSRGVLPVWCRGPYPPLWREGWGAGRRPGQRESSSGDAGPRPGPRGGSGDCPPEGLGPAASTPAPVPGWGRPGKRRPEWAASRAAPQPWGAHGTAAAGAARPPPTRPASPQPPPRQRLMTPSVLGPPQAGGGVGDGQCGRLVGRRCRHSPVCISVLRDVLSLGKAGLLETRESCRRLWCHHSKCGGGISGRCRDPCGRVPPPPAQRLRPERLRTGLAWEDFRGQESPVEEEGPKAPAGDDSDVELGLRRVVSLVQSHTARERSGTSVALLSGIQGPGRKDRTRSDWII